MMCDCMTGSDKAGLLHTIECRLSQETLVKSLIHNESRGIVCKCDQCQNIYETLEQLEKHSMNTGHNFRSDKYFKKEKAKRDSVDYRYDILVPYFMETMAKIASFGAEKYGDLNWQKSRLVGQNGPVNHIMKHLNSYQTNKEYDHLELGCHRKYHLAAIAFNAMMEFWYEENMKDVQTSKENNL